MISVYLLMFCIPQVENGTQRCGEDQTDREQEKRSRRAGASSVAVRHSPSDLNQKLRSLSSSLGRYHELRRDRGRWVGYVREAGGINWANLQARCSGSKREHPPRRAVRASRHGPQTAPTLFVRDSLRTDLCPSCRVGLRGTWSVSGLPSNKVRWGQVCCLKWFAIRCNLRILQNKCSCTLFSHFFNLI